MAGFAEVAQRQDQVDRSSTSRRSPSRRAEAAMPGAEPWEYYGTERSASPGWRNQVTRLSIRELLTFDAAIGADFIAPTPTLIVHGRLDDFCSPADAQDVYDRITGPEGVDVARHHQPHRPLRPTTPRPAGRGNASPGGWTSTSVDDGPAMLEVDARVA